MSSFEAHTAGHWLVQLMQCAVFSRGWYIMRLTSYDERGNPECFRLKRRSLGRLAKGAAYLTRAVWHFKPGEARRRKGFHTGEKSKPLK
jgi:hypothetical protein